MPNEFRHLRRFTLLAATFTAVVEACGGDDSTNPIPIDGGADRSVGGDAAQVDAFAASDTTTLQPEAAIDVLL